MAKCECGCELTHSELRATPVTLNDHKAKMDAEDEALRVEAWKGNALLREAAAMLVGVLGTKEPK